MSRSRQPLIVLGASGHSRVVIDAVRASGEFELIGLLDQLLPVGSQIDGVEVLGPDDALAGILSANPRVQLICGIGANNVRRQAVEKCLAICPDIKFGTVVHPSAIIAKTTSIGSGTFLAAGTVINAGAKIGDHVIVNTRASIDHDCVVEGYAFIGPAAALAGNVSVGQEAFIGICAAVTQGIEIGSKAVVGAGAAVVRNVPPGLTVVGVPARTIRT